MAFSGALLATLVVYRLARGRAGATPERLILPGLFVTTFLSVRDRVCHNPDGCDRIRSFTFWLWAISRVATKTCWL